MSCQITKKGTVLSKINDIDDHRAKKLNFLDTVEGPLYINCVFVVAIIAYFDLLDFHN